MHRGDLLSLLARYQPHSQTEVVCKQRMIDFVCQYSACFERTLAVGHMTGSAWLVDKANARVLLTLHAKFDEWLQLGGHCDGDSDILHVACKEAREESGIQGIVPLSRDIFDIDIHHIPANSRDPEHYHYDVRFILQVASEEQIMQSVESKDLQWFTRDAESLPTHNPSILRMFNKWITQFPVAN